MFKIAPAEKLPSATFLVQALPVFQEGLHPAAALADCDQSAEETGIFSN